MIPPPPPPFTFSFVSALISGRRSGGDEGLGSRLDIGDRIGHQATVPGAAADGPGSRLLSIATKIVPAGPVRGILQGGHQVFSTILMYTEKRPGPGTRNNLSCNREYPLKRMYERGRWKNLHQHAAATPPSMIHAHMQVVLHHQLQAESLRLFGRTCIANCSDRQTVVVVQLARTGSRLIASLSRSAADIGQTRVRADKHTEARWARYCRWKRANRKLAGRRVARRDLPGQVLASKGVRTLATWWCRSALQINSFRWDSQPVPATLSAVVSAQTDRQTKGWKCLLHNKSQLSQGREILRYYVKRSMPICLSTAHWKV